MNTSVCFSFYHLSNPTLPLCLPVGLFCSHFSLSVFCERLLYEAPLMGLSGIYWTSVGDLTRCVRACARTPKCVCFSDCHVGSYITALFHLCYCVHSHSKAIRFYTKSWSWELWSWVRCNRRDGLPLSAFLYSWSLVQYHSQLELQLHFHMHIFDSVALSVLYNPHKCTSVSGAFMEPVFKSPTWCFGGGGVGSDWSVGACKLWMLLMPPIQSRQVFVPSGPIEVSLGHSATNDVADWSHLTC